MHRLHSCTNKQIMECAIGISIYVGLLFDSIAFLKQVDVAKTLKVGFVCSKQTEWPPAADWWEVENQYESLIYEATN